MGELKPLHEQWSGIPELVPTSAYGVRVYRNGSALAMHYDKVRTMTNTCVNEYSTYTITVYHEPIEE